MWSMGPYFQRVSNTGKLKLEGTKRAEGPSRLDTDPKFQNKIKVKGEGKGKIRGIRDSKVDQEEYTKVMKAATQDIESWYFKPDPLFQLIGESNEANIPLDGNKLPALIDSGAQVSAMTQKLAKQMKIKVHKLNKLLQIEGTGGGKVLY